MKRFLIVTVLALAVSAMVACSKEDKLPVDAAESRWVAVAMSPVVHHPHSNWQVSRREVTLKNIDTGKVYRTALWAEDESFLGEIKPNQTFNLKPSSDNNAWYVKTPENLADHSGTIILRETNTDTDDAIQGLAFKASNYEMSDDAEKRDAIQKKEMEAQAQAAKKQNQADEARCEQEYPREKHLGAHLDCVAAAECERGNTAMCASVQRVYEDQMAIACPNGYTTDSYGTTRCNDQKPVDVRIVP